MTDLHFVPWESMADSKVVKNAFFFAMSIASSAPPPDTQTRQLLHAV